MEFKIKIDEAIKDRVNKILLKLEKSIHISDCEFIIAGNALNNVNRSTDIDIFVLDDMQEKNLEDALKAWSVHSTRNAITYEIGTNIVQLCKYRYGSLKGLVDSFDYSHIQIGVLIKNLVPEEVYFTEEYIEAKILGNSTYMGSKYPLSSIIRALKYKEYGELSKNRMVMSVILAVTDLIERGVEDYDDFKDQLDAVDLGVLPSDFKDFGDRKDRLTDLFNLLVTDKNLQYKPKE